MGHSVEITGLQQAGLSLSTFMNSKYPPDEVPFSIRLRGEAAPVANVLITVSGNGQEINEWVGSADRQILESLSLGRSWESAVLAAIDLAVQHWHEATKTDS